MKILKVLAWIALSVLYCCCLLPNTAWCIIAHDLSCKLINTIGWEGVGYLGVGLSWFWGILCHCGFIIFAFAQVYFPNIVMKD